MLGDECNKLFYKIGRSLLQIPDSGDRLSLEFRMEENVISSVLDRIHDRS
jgi:hypothetical protein